MSADSEFLRRAEDGDGSFAIAWSILRLASAVRDLGNGDAATPMGAIEAFGMHLGEKIDTAATQLAESVESALMALAPHD